MSARNRTEARRAETARPPAVLSRLDWPWRPAGLRRAGRLAAASVLVLAAACQTVTSVSPSVALPGSTITIGGTGFGASVVAGDFVKLDGASLEIVSWSDTRIVAKLPAVKPNGTYPLTVTVTNYAVSAPPVTIDNTLPISNVTITENPSNILSATVEFDTAVSTTPALQVQDASGSYWLPASALLSPHPSTHHKMMVLGLHEASSYALTIQINASGTPRWQSFLYSTRPIPSDFEIPPVTLKSAQPSLMQPGVTLLAANYGNTPTGGLYAVDAQGKLVWYHQEAPGVQVSAFRRRANGNLMYIATGIREIDMMGNLVRSFDSTALGATEAHHEILELPNGNFVTLGVEMRPISGYPPNNLTYNVVGDIIIEFTPSGQVVDRINMFDLLDPYRIPYWVSFDYGQYDQLYGMHTEDWTHLNAVVYDPSDGNFIVSSRNQDMVFKIDRHTHQMVWIIGADLPSTTGDDHWPFLTLDGPGLLPSHQHAPELEPDGSILLYDNDTDRPTLPHKSRPVFYRVSPQAKTVQEGWSWIDPAWNPPIFSYFSGDANLLPNGNVLVDDAGVWDAIPLGLRWMRLAEVRPSDDLKVWEITIRQDFPTMPWTGYRAERYASLYPQ